MAISHLFYADNAVFIGEWSDSNLDNIVKNLKCFFLASGLKINIQKSQVLGVGVPRNIVNQAASLIECAVMQNPCRYLEVMVGDSMSRKLAWADTVQKLRSRLSKWKVKTLSIGGRLTLLKLVLGASPLYNMSIYKVPKDVLKEIEAIRCNFFNGADPAERKLTWVSWDKVLASKKNGGLGVSSFHALNRALLSCYSSFVRCFFLSYILLISLRFCALFYPLRVRFPRLFALETDKESTVASKLGYSSVDGSFRRSVRDGVERQQWDDLNSVSGSVTLSASKDRWICDLNGDGVFRVKEVRTVLDDIFLPSAADATRWVKYISIKINVFAWRARLDHWNAWFSAIRLPSRIKLILEGVFYVAWWHLWVYRNQFIFATTHPKRSVIFDDIFSRSFTNATTLLLRRRLRPPPPLIYSVKKIPSVKMWKKMNKKVACMFLYVCVCVMLMNERRV
nr:RNA-directed DNA polymerase, eukaryota, reverse transcriptase zinc-binding domain protein [Tanacetum cinerariifolium]